MSALDSFSLAGRTAVITGGAGLLGAQHAEAVSEAGGVPVLWDIDGGAAGTRAVGIPNATGMAVDITNPDAVISATEKAISRFGRIDILINNAANDAKVGPESDMAWNRFENFALDMWERDMAVGLTGAFLCAQAVGAHMARGNGGVILNIASDLSVISPDQRLYRRDGLPDDQQPVKPVSYSVVKHGVVGLTKYLATYWADRGVRVNAISPGGVYTDQSDDFVAKLADLIPLGRMARQDEYKAAVIFLCSDASSYMTGQNLIIDGGRTVL
jgi:NAD(P)-dependent dehydrogenase (short-subunit alcohol dehydrogenase family)